jgi:flagellar operon protein
MSDPRILFPLQPIASTTTNSNPVTVKNPVAVTAPNFRDVLKREINQVKFSQHALQRLESRNIKLDSEQMQRLQGAVDKAAQKGSRESLVLMDNTLAFVVSVRNRTVITAMDGTSIKDNVFTNIDSAIVM